MCMCKVFRDALQNYYRRINAINVWLVLGKVVNRPIYIFREINNSFKSKMEGTNLDQILAQNRFFRRKN